jgi:TonB family protein
MNQLDEQKSLIEFLESALTQAKNGNSPEAGELEGELKTARLEYGRLLRAQKRGTMEKSDMLPVSAATLPVVTKEVVPELKLCLNVNSEFRFKSFLSSFRSVFGAEKKEYKITAQPIQANLMLSSSPWHRNILGNLKSYLGKERKDYSHITATPITTHMLLDSVPWHRALREDLKALFSRQDPSKLNLTAQPLEVDEIFKEYKFRSSSVLVSAFLHVFVIAAVIIAPILFISSPRSKSAIETEVSLLDPNKMLFNLPPQAEKSGGGGGGGDQTPKPASLGKLPRAADRQFTPPTTKVINLDPEMPMEPTIVAPQLANLPSLNLAQFGDPLGIPGPPSNGPGMGGGIGTGSGGGVGSGRGAGFGPGEGGGFGGGVYRVGGGVTSPIVVYRVEPTYSEEARKAKYQGVVVLQAIVRKDGTIEILKVVRGLGLGLDENAISALKQWKFRPATKNGVPVDVALNIEVNFTLR